MHPNPLFGTVDRDRMMALVGDIGFGMVFCTTPEGPRVAHTPLVPADGKALRFHLSRGNALADHLSGGTALICVNGPHGYVSPRWYADRDTVPTWDYVAVELEGPVRQLTDAELEDLLHATIERSEGTLGGSQWSARETSEPVWARLFRGIAGFELTVEQWRPTFKLSQKRTADERRAIAEGLAAHGNPALATAMRADAVWAAL